MLKTDNKIFLGILMLHNHTAISVFFKVFDILTFISPQNFRRPSGGIFFNLNHTKHNISIKSPPQARKKSHFHLTFQNLSVLRALSHNILSDFVSMEYLHFLEYFSFRLAYLHFFKKM